MTINSILRTLSLLVLFSCSMYGQTADFLYGHWRVTKVANAGPVTAIRGMEADRLIGHVLVLTPTTLRFANRTCQPTYNVSHETSTEFFENSGIEAKTVDLPDPATHFEADCTDIFVLSSDRILFTWKGVFLQARKLPARKRSPEQP